MDVGGGVGQKCAKVLMKGGGRRPATCQGDDVGVRTAYINLNLAEACPGVDVWI